MADRVCVAQIGAAHGIRGEVRLHAFTEEPMAVAEYGPLESEDGTRRFVIEALRPAKDCLVARLAGVGDRNAAEALRHVKLFVPRERLPALDDEETFYHADLIGLAATTQDGTDLGTVVAVSNFGAGDIIEVQPKSGGATVMLPFTQAVVPTVNLPAGKIVIDPPEGTFSPSRDAREDRQA